MKTNERKPGAPLRAVALALCLAWIAGACGGSTLGAPTLGSESHFLSQCEVDCGDGLSCISGVCTRACLTDSSSCFDLGTGASCTNQSIEPGAVAVCDVSCSDATGCSALGDAYQCESGFCRRPSSGAVGAAPLCEAYADRTPPPQQYAISIVNTGAQALYLRPFDVECRASFLSVARDGEALRVSATCSESCQQAINAGWSRPREEGPGPDDTCFVDCDRAEPRPVRLEPGQTLTEAPRLELAFERMPPGCAEGISTDAVNCYVRQVPAPGNYTLTLHAFLELDCVDPSLDCACQPDASGACTNANVSLGFGTAPVVVTVERPRYYDSQIVEVSAPP